MTRDEAIALAETKWWENATDQQIIGFQLFESKLCMDFGAYHAAVERVLGRPVFTHEFADYASLQREFLGDKPAPTMEEIVNMIPEAKRILVAVSK
jgi:hypothetical protein